MTNKTFMVPKLYNKHALNYSHFYKIKEIMYTAGKFAD